MTCEISFLQELDLIRGEYGEHFAGTGAQIQMSENSDQWLR